MSQDEFTKLFLYVQELRQEMNERFDETASKKDLNGLINAVDAFAKQSETYMQEMLALSHKVIGWSAG